MGWRFYKLPELLILDAKVGYSLLTGSRRRALYVPMHCSWSKKFEIPITEIPEEEAFKLFACVYKGIEND